jgi:hypothetical protein
MVKNLIIREGELLTYTRKKKTTHVTNVIIQNLLDNSRNNALNVYKSPWFIKSIARPVDSTDVGKEIEAPSEPFESPSNLSSGRTLQKTLMFPFNSYKYEVDYYLKSKSYIIVHQPLI